MVLFKDLSKTSSDILTRDYVHEKPIDIEVKSFNTPLTITATASLDKGATDSSVQVAYACKAIKSSAKFSSGASTLDLTYFLPATSKLGGLSFQAKHDMKKGKNTTELATEYLTNKCHSRLSYFPLAQTFAASTLFSLQDDCIKLGADLTGNIDGKSLKYSLGTSTSCKKHGVALSFKTAPAALGAPNKFLAAAHMKKGESDFAVEAAVGTDLTAAVALAVTRQINPDLSYKARYVDGKVAVALTQRLSTISSVTLGVEHDGKADGLKMGTKFNFAQ